jgi:20S proteasome alpha/beta subunit
VTLAVAIKATDAVIIAADSRGTIGDPRGLTAVNDTQQKVFQFGNCALAIAGASEIALTLLDEFARQGFNPQNIDEAVMMFSQVAANLCDQWFRNIPPDQRPGTLFLLGGYRHPPGGAPVPMVFMLTSNTHFAPQLSNNYPMMIGVPQYAVYLSHRYYDPSISADGAAALAEYLISETASQDPKVGGQVRMAKVTAQAFTMLTDAEVAALRAKNQKLNNKLKRFFTNGGK